MAISKLVVKNLEKSTCGLFSTRDTTTEAADYALRLLRHASKNEIDMCVHTAIGVYHNTLVGQTIKMVKSLEDTDLDKIQEKLSDALQSDLEHGVASLNKEASEKFAKGYPELCKAIGEINAMEVSCE